jgi:2'-5' RNA ligase
MVVAGKTYKTAVVVIPPEDTWAPIQAIREKHDRAFQRWMPHITLLYPFRPRSDFETAAVRLTRACESIASFEVTLASFDVFQHSQDSYTLWLTPEPKEALVQLHRALWRSFPDCDDVRRFAGDFTPHLSVGQVRGREQMQHLVSALSRDWGPTTFRVSVVSLIWRDDPPRDVFRVTQTIALGTI